MQQGKIKLKYMMGLWKHLPEYPSEGDLIYEITLYLAKDGRPNGEFTRQTLKSALGKGWEESAHKAVFESLVESGQIQKTPGKDESKDKFRIVHNPYYGDTPAG